ncbi:MAG: hypothetical protein RSB86_16675 [Comamonas sp.]|uniref:hypothetical protein n=1 Tax=Comamonas sp. TaxID=34028 RepID=UPI002FCA3357
MTASAAVNTAPTSPHWPQAMEFMLGQLVFVLDANNVRGFSTDALNRWIDTCTARMTETGSAAPELVAELRALQERVLA